MVSILWKYSSRIFDHSTLLPGRFDHPSPRSTSAIMNSANSTKPGNTVSESMASAIKAGAADQGLPIRQLYPTTGNTLLLQYSWKKTTGRQIMARNIKITPGKVNDHIPNDKNKKSYPYK